MDEEKDLKPNKENKKDNKRNKTIVIGCIVALIIIICGCGVLAVTSFGLLSYFGGEPEGLGLQTQYPWTVQKGDSFELILSITNSGNKPLMVEDIDLDVSFSTSILDGTVVDKTEPFMEKDYSISGIKTFKFNQSLGPGESQDVIFYLRAIEAGDHGGQIAVYVGDQAVWQDVSITVFP